MTQPAAIGFDPAALPARQPRRLHILVVTGSYAPDPTGMAPLNTELCEYLASRGHRVSVATCFPHYPEWRVPEAYRGKLWQRETLRGVTLYRGYSFIPAKRTTLRRILYDTSIGLCAALRGLPVRRPDLVLAVSPPLQAALAGAFLARAKRAPFLLQIKDLVPDLAIALGMLRNPAAIKLARALENYVYRRADAVLAICEGFAANLRSKGVSPAKICVVPDWVDTAVIRPEAARNGFRRDHGLGEADFLALHIGNMGAKQKLDTVLDAAARIQEEPGILFCFVGDGAEKARLQQSAQARALANVRFLPLQPRENLPAILSSADVLLLHQSANVADMVIPSKLLTYMAAGRPIVAAAARGSEAAQCVERAGCGLVVQPEDPAALAQAICRLRSDRELGSRLGRQGRRFAEQHFARDQILERLESSFVLAAEHKRKKAEIP